MSNLSIDTIAGIRDQALELLSVISDVAALEAWRIAVLGRKGELPQLLRQVKDLPAPERRAVGSMANEVRAQLEAVYEQRMLSLAPTASVSPERQAPESGSVAVPAGHLHPLTQLIYNVESIMVDLGFSMIEGPLLEDTKHDFDNLNIDREHPARAETDTFYVNGSRDAQNRRVLRTSTSSVQVRAVLELGLTSPFKIFSPGRVFRNEKVDATHSHTFHQLEAVSIGEQVSVADFRGVVNTLFSELFSTEATTRLRPHYFPFTEPSFEVDLACVFCTDGCRICKGTSWIEIGGAGMVHPQVMANMKIDATKYQGFAFGFGLERLAMLLHGIDDIRLFWGNDLRFLRQF